MKKPNVCLFIGNRIAEDTLYPAVFEAVGGLIEQGVTEFWSGGYGNFDRMGERAVREWKARGAQAKLVLVVAYPPMPQSDPGAKDYYSGFDEIYEPDLGSTPKRLAIVKRNDIIAREAGHVIAGVKYPFAGAARALKTAISAGAVIHDVLAADEPEEK